MGKQRLRHRKNPMFFPPAAEEWISLILTCLCNILSGFPLFSCFLTLNQSLNSKPMVLNLGQFWPPGTSNNVWVQLWLSHSLYVSHIHRDSPEERAYKYVVVEANNFSISPSSPFGDSPNPNEHFSQHRKSNEEWGAWSNILNGVVDSAQLRSGDWRKPVPYVSNHVQGYDSDD